MVDVDIEFMRLEISKQSAARHTGFLERTLWSPLRGVHWDHPFGRF